MKLRLSDPAYVERLVAFLESVGQKGIPVGATDVELERDLPEAELQMYLRVWSVLYPEATVTLE